jgi:hypothetical protein
VLVRFVARKRLTGVLVDRQSAVARMISAGGTAGYWKKTFSPPATEKLLSTWATHLYAQVRLLLFGEEGQGLGLRMCGLRSRVVCELRRGGGAERRHGGGGIVRRLVECGVRV